MNINIFCIIALIVLSIITVAKKVFATATKSSTIASHYQKPNPPPKTKAYPITTIRDLTVTKIVDGDTIWVKDKHNQTYKIRLLGINAPEICTIPKEQYSIEAKDRVEHLLRGSKVYITFNSSHKYDKYKRILANVYRSNDNYWINLDLIKTGLAYVYVIDNYVPNITLLLNAEHNSINKRTNIWSLNTYLPINQTTAINYLNQYKIVRGEIARVISTPKNFWLIFKDEKTSSNSQQSTTTIKFPVEFSSDDDFQRDNKSALAIKISKKHFSQPYNFWAKYVNKTVAIRGYINKPYPNFIPYITLKNINTLQIL